MPGPEMNEAHRVVVAQSHYPFVTRCSLNSTRVVNCHRYQLLDIEPAYGHVGRIVYKDGAVRMFRNTSWGINPQGSAEISKDKGYTKYFLDGLGYSTPAGKVFLLPDYVQLIDRNLARYSFTGYARVEDIYRYIETVTSYPCFIKPNDGSQGRGVTKCYDQADVEAVVMTYQRERINLVLVEQAIPYPDYRVVVLHDQVVACYQRRPLTVVGDGAATMTTLLHRKQDQLAHEGRKVFIDLDDPRITKKLGRMDYSLESVPAEGEEIAIYDVANLSAGGTSEDFTDRIHPYWRDLCVNVANAVGLKFCGVDLACADITAPQGSYSILETNAAPGLDNFARSGERPAQIVRELFRAVFNSSEN